MKKNSSGLKKGSSNADLDYDNKSDDSDISYYTSEKVFNGAFKKLMKANRQNDVKENSLGSLNSISNSNSMRDPGQGHKEYNKEFSKEFSNSGNTKEQNKENKKEQYAISVSKEISNLNIQQNQNNHNNQQNIPSTHKDTKKLKNPKINLKIEDTLQNGNSIASSINNSPHHESYRKINPVSSPISFRPNIQEEMEKVVINDGIVQLKKDDEGVSNVSSTSPASKFKREPKENKKSNYTNQEKTTSTNTNQLSSNPISNLNPKKKEQFQIDTEIMKKMLVSSDEERDDGINPEDSFENINNNPNDPQDQEKNIFWNLNNKETPNEEYEKFMSKRSNSVNKGEFAPSNSGRLNSLNSRFNYKTPTMSQVSCTISKIEKGVAVLVSSDDYIFTLPVCFLPRNLVPGNSYQITIDETVKIQKKVSSIQQMQMKYIKK
jgi:hypothetical protein